MQAQSLRPDLKDGSTKKSFALLLRYPVLLLYDGSFVSYKARQNVIHLLCLPSHCSYLYSNSSAPRCWQSEHVHVVRWQLGRSSCNRCNIGWVSLLIISGPDQDGANTELEAAIIRFLT